MATSGSFSTNQVKAGSRTWYWDFNWWVDSWTGNPAKTAKVKWTAISRATSGTSGQSYVSNYGFEITVNGNRQSIGGNFYKDNTIASGSFDRDGGTSFSVSITAHPYGGSYTSSGSGSWTLDTNIVKPSVKLSIASVSETTVTLTGTITSNGNGTITANGYKYKQQGGSTWLNCTNSLTNLTPNTTYYFKYYATNSAGTTEVGADNKIYTTTWNKPTISNVAVKNLIAGNSQTVTLNNSHNRNCTIKVTKVDGGTVLYTGSTTGTSLTFTIPADKCRLALGSESSENKTPVNLTYTCSYSSWSTPYDTSPSCTLGINTTYKPTWNSNFDINAAITYRDTNSTSRNITGDPQILVQGKSQWAYSLALKGTQAAIKNSNSESNIKKYQISFDGFKNYLEIIEGAVVEKTDLKGGTITRIVSEDDGADVTSSSLSVSIRAVDCKGVTSDIKTKTISVIPYNVPSGTISANRVNNYGKTIQLKINPSWAIVSKNNEERAEISYKLAAAPESDYTVLDNNVKNFNTFITLSPSFDNSSGYNFKVKLYDAFGGESAEIKALVGRGMPIFFIDETVNGVGVNTIPYQQGLYVDGDLKVTNTINNTFKVSVGTTNNYPYHRIAYTPVRIYSYEDNSIVLLLTAGYQNGPYGIVKCDLRTDDVPNGHTAGASAVWLSRYGFSADQVVLGLKNTAGNSYLDIFVKTSAAYNSIVVTPLFVGERGAFNTSAYALCDSKEDSGTTATDPLTSYESYSAISATASANKGPRTYTNVITAVDGGNVNFSNNIQVDTTNPSSQTTYYPTFVTGSGSQRERINNGILHISKEGTASVNGEAYFRIGNGTASGTAGNKKGYLQLYGQNTGRAQLEYKNTTTNVTHTLPAISGTYQIQRAMAQIRYKRQNLTISAGWTSVPLTSVADTMTLGSGLTIDSNKIKINNSTIKKVKITASVISFGRNETGDTGYAIRRVSDNTDMTNILYCNYNPSYKWHAGDSITMLLNVSQNQTFAIANWTNIATSCEHLGAVLLIEDVTEY